MLSVPRRRAIGQSYLRKQSSFEELFRKRLLEWLVQWLNHGEISGIYREGNIRPWKPLPKD
jgi:hypothetical protein